MSRTKSEILDGQFTFQVKKRPLGLYFHHAPGLDNSAGYRFDYVTVREWDGQTLVDEAGGWKFLAGNPETFTHDDDGNLLSDGRWEYSWDGENRLIRMEETRESSGPSLPQRRARLNFVYDHMGRRSHKFIERENYLTKQFMPETFGDRRFLYTGWHLFAEIYQGFGPVRTYLWGMDIAETAGSPYRGAGLPGDTTGGVGALLALTTTSNGNGFYPLYDGRGNVIGLFDPDGPGTVVAEYEYGPFGELLRETGDGAYLSRFRYSTKWQDTHNDLYYYGYRYYSPSMGRFLNRDPIEEQGGLNLYAFVHNDPINYWDYQGLFSVSADFAVGKGLAIGASGSLTVDRPPPCWKVTVEVTAWAGVGIGGRVKPNYRGRDLGVNLFFGGPRIEQKREVTVERLADGTIVGTGTFEIIAINKHYSAGGGVGIGAVAFEVSGSIDLRFAAELRVTATSRRVDAEVGGSTQIEGFYTAYLRIWRTTWGHRNMPMFDPIDDTSVWWDGHVSW